MEKFLNLFDAIKQFFVKEGMLHFPEVPGWILTPLNERMAMYTQEDSKKGNQFLFDFKQEGQEISKVYVYPLRKGSGYPKVNKASGVWEEFMEKVKEGQKEAVLTVN